MSEHPYKFGRREIKFDERTFQLASLVRRITKVPLEYNFDVAHPGIHQRMWRNDDLGDCVIAARANATIRFEFVEKKRIIKITDLDVTAEYFKETGGEDTGLVILDSLVEWRKYGWLNGLKIKAFASISPAEHPLMRSSIYSHLGSIAGLTLPVDALDEFVAGKPWLTPRGPGQDGHCVYLVGYTKLGPVCLTWARPQQISWKYWDRYADECYSVIDANDSSKLLDHSKLNSLLTSLKGTK